jgi:hypothetical protein
MVKRSVVTGDRSWSQDISGKKQLSRLSIPNLIAIAFRIDARQGENFQFAASFDAQDYLFWSVVSSGSEFNLGGELANQVEQAAMSPNRPIELDLVILDGVDLSYALIDPTHSVEGEARLVTHWIRERDPAIIRAKRDLSEKPFACQVCCFDYSKRYGDLGEDFIEVHHLRPISSRSESARTDLEGLILICANCHRMAHRFLAQLGTQACHTLDELKRGLNTRACS